MGQHLNILVQSSEYYAPFAGVMLTSLFENNKEIGTITVYLMTSDMSGKNRGRFQSLAEQYQRTIKFIDTKEIDCFLENHQAPRYHGAYTPYYKIFALSVIKDEIDRLIYLDSDMVVTGSLSELLNWNLGDNALGMCIDAIPSRYKEIIKCDSQFYYNTGMIVFNVKRWNKTRGMDRVINHLTNVWNAYPVVEQDLLNIIFSGEIATLPQKYNLNTGTMIFPEYNLFKKVYGVRNYYSNDEFIHAIEEPIIVHYIGPFNTRPWLDSNLPAQYWPAKKLWREQHAQSLWNDIPAIYHKMPIISRVQFIMYRILPNGLFAIVHQSCIYISLLWKARRLGLKND